MHMQKNKASKQNTEKKKGKENAAESSIVIDGNGMIVGRSASRIAKMLLDGKKVTLLNAESMFISGHERELLEKYKRRFELQDKANPEHSPYWSKRPDIFVKRIIRGMLPFKKAKGKSAFKMLRVYAGVPETMKGANVYKLEAKQFTEVYENTVKVSSLLAKL
jgi:large subunit ribosomal protein L13